MPAETDNNKKYFTPNLTYAQGDKVRAFFLSSNSKVELLAAAATPSVHYVPCYYSADREKKHR